MFQFPNYEPPNQAPGGLRLLLAPMNFANQPMALMNAMRRKGHYARHIQYTATGSHPLAYSLDGIAQLRGSDTIGQLDVLERCLDERFDIYHFWQRSLLFDRDLSGLTGLDLPLIKSCGSTIFHRFTGFDLRMPTLDRQFNPHSPYLHGYVSPFEEERQTRYIEFLKEYVDVFFVQDPELKQFLPEAIILPRGLSLNDWQPAGIMPTDRPLVVHAPSNPQVKGSDIVVSALEELSREGLVFDFKLLTKVPHAEALEWYKRADIIIDQILIGATGVLTLEAWALQKPCVTYLREDLFEPFYKTSDLPVANANPSNITSVLRTLVRDFEWRQDLARRGRETVEKFHDIEQIAKQYESICIASRRGKERSHACGGAAAFLREGIDRKAPLAVRKPLKVTPAPSPFSLGTGLGARFPKTAASAIAIFQLELRFMEAAIRGQQRLIKAIARVYQRISKALTRAPKT